MPDRVKVKITCPHCGIATPVIVPLDHVEHEPDAGQEKLAVGTVAPGVLARLAEMVK